MGPFSEALCNFCSESSPVEAVNSCRICSLPVLSHQTTQEVTNSSSDSKPLHYLTYCYIYLPNFNPSKTFLSWDLCWYLPSPNDCLIRSP